MKARTILLLALLLVLFAVPASASVAVFTVGSDSCFIDGQQFSMDAAPYQDGRVFVPLRYAAQAAGVGSENIFYNNGKITLVKGSTVVQLAAGSNVMVKGGSMVTMDAAPVIVNGRTMLPIRWVAQALDAQVDWNGNTRQVVVRTVAVQPQPTQSQPVQPQPVQSQPVQVQPQSNALPDDVDETDIEDVTTPSVADAVQKGKIPPLSVRPETGVIAEPARPVVIGSPYFQKTVNDALNLLYEKDREDYYLVCHYLPKVEEAPGSFVVITDHQAQTFFFNLPQDYPEEDALYYTVGGLVHEATHVWLAEKGYQTTGEAGEYFATAAHTRALLKVGAPGRLVEDPDEAIKARWWERPEQPVKAAPVTRTPSMPSGGAIVAGSETEPGCREVSVSWNPVADATGYKVYFCIWIPEKNTWGGTWCMAAQKTDYPLDLVMGKIYHVWVTAVNSAGESNPLDFGYITVSKQGVANADLPGQNSGGQ